MSTEYKETEAPEDDTRSEVLGLFAKGHPWAFIFAVFDEDGAMDLKLEVGGGIRDASTVRALLEKTLAALP